jgi:hypothetical protein
MGAMIERINVVKSRNSYECVSGIQKVLMKKVLTSGGGSTKNGRDAYKKLAKVVSL